MEIIVETAESRCMSGNEMIYDSYALIGDKGKYYVGSKQAVFELDGYDSGDLIEQDDSYSFRASDELMLVKREGGIVEVLPKYLLGIVRDKIDAHPLQSEALAALYVLAEYTPDHTEYYRRLKEEYRQDYCQRLAKVL